MTSAEYVKTVMGYLFEEDVVDYNRIIDLMERRDRLMSHTTGNEKQRMEVADLVQRIDYELSSHSAENVKEAQRRHKGTT